MKGRVTSAFVRALPCPFSFKKISVDIYEYIAQMRPQEAEAVCNKYGWTLQSMETPEDLANCLENLVAEEGEPAFLDLLAIHPDKDVIIEAYNGQDPAAPAAGGSGGCGCAGCKGKSEGSAVDKAVSSASAAIHNSGSFFHQSNLMIIGGVVLIGLALVLKNKD